MGRSQKLARRTPRSMCTTAHAGDYIPNFTHVVLYECLLALHQIHLLNFFFYTTVTEQAWYLNVGILQAYGLFKWMYLLQMSSFMTYLSTMRQTAQYPIKSGPNAPKTAVDAIKWHSFNAGSLVVMCAVSLIKRPLVIWLDEFAVRSQFEALSALLYAYLQTNSLLRSRNQLEIYVNTGCINHMHTLCNVVVCCFGFVTDPHFYSHRHRC